MYLFKRLKDHFIKFILGAESVPRGLSDLQAYFRFYGPINFKFEKKDNVFVAISKDFKYGSIITQGNSKKELDIKIKDAILTVFEVPASYSKEANIKKISKNKREKYAFA